MAVWGIAPLQAKPKLDRHKYFIMHHINTVLSHKARTHSPCGEILNTEMPTLKAAATVNTRGQRDLARAEENWVRKQTKGVNEIV